MHDEQAAHRDEATAPDPAPSPSALGTELGRLGRAARRLFDAHRQLLAAELGLARSAAAWLLLAALLATVAAVALGLTLLGLVGLLLATWLGSWIPALLLLALLQVLLLAGAIALFRRCLHWISLPATRGEWGAMMRGTLHPADDEAGQAGDKGDAR